jgi:hypothetical protein
MDATRIASEGKFQDKVLEAINRIPIDLACARINEETYKKLMVSNIQKQDVDMADLCARISRNSHRKIEFYAALGIQVEKK